MVGDYKCSPDAELDEGPCLWVGVHVGVVVPLVTMGGGAAGGGAIAAGGGATAGGAAATGGRMAAGGPTAAGGGVTARGGGEPAAVGIAAARGAQAQAQALPIPPPDVQATTLGVQVRDPVGTRAQAQAPTGNVGPPVQ